MHSAFRIFLTAYLPAACRDASDKPFSIPQFPVAYFFDMLCGCLVLFRIFPLSQMLCQADELRQCPVMQETDHSAFSAAQVQTIVPIRPQSFADSRLSHLLCGKVQNPFQMPVNRFRFAASVQECVCIRILRRGEISVPCFFYIFRHCRYQPERIIGTGVL